MSSAYMRMRSGGGVLKGWPVILGLSYVLEAWDPAKNVTIATGVSDWDGRKLGITMSQLTGSKQPTFNASGSCPSGAPSVSFAKASLQWLQATTFPAGFAAFDANDYRVYALLRWTSLSGSPCVWSAGDLSAIVLSNLYATTAGQVAIQVYDGSSKISFTPSLSYTVNDDVWAYGSQDPGVSVNAGVTGSIAPAGPTATLSGTDSFAVGARRYNTVTDRYLEGEVYGVIMTTREITAAEHDVIAEQANVIMGT